MLECADLEIGLHHRDLTSYTIELRFTPAQSDAEIRLGDGQAQFDLDTLASLKDDLPAYAEALTSCLFADPAVRRAYAESQTNAASQETQLRLRLMVGPSAPELHDLRWETLRDPESAVPLCIGENLYFSRYLSSQDRRPVRLRSRSELRAMILVANPSNLADYHLTPIDVQGEIGRAKTGLGSIWTRVLPEDKRRATLANLLSDLRDDPREGGWNRGYHILYLICHGQLVKGEPWLWLEDDQGQVVRTLGRELVTQLNQLQHLPRLVVLASCESGGKAENGTDTGEALAALGPRLGRAGIPAVIAMQGNISMQTVAEAMPVFFKELRKDGQIDRALSVARGVVRQRFDYWMPALFMRLKSGRIWQSSEVSPKTFVKWPALVRSIQIMKCTPIIGPGIYESALGSLQEIAWSWARTYNYPLYLDERESLPQVAQYLSIEQYAMFPLQELEDYIKQTILGRYRKNLPKEILQKPAQLDELIEAVWAARVGQIPGEPHAVLAQLPLPIYISTTVNNLMAAALRSAGKKPKVVLCPWNETLLKDKANTTLERSYIPSVEEPLVYHLFGRLNVPGSVVLTEDDYFDFLIGVSANKKLIPEAVRVALSDSALLFLGFQVNDWDFRVLWHSLLSKETRERRKLYPHIAVQIDPEEGSALSPERARGYLERYFSKTENISLFWGSADLFSQELLTRWNEQKKEVSSYAKP